MNRRTVYLQEILQAGDILQAQKNAMIGLNAHVQATHGFGFFSTFPGNDLTRSNLSNTTLSVTVPPVMMYSTLNQDTTAWPPTGPPILGTDSTSLLTQGWNFANTVLVWGSPGGTGSYWVLIEGQVQTTDATLTNLPFYPLIQTQTVGSASTTSTINVTSSQGFAPGDLILVQGFTTVNGGPAIVQTVSPGQLILNSSNLLTAAPNSANISVRDLVPNNGLPLNGINNNGGALNIDRLNVVNLQTKVGASSGTPVKPTPDVNFTAMWYIGPFLVGDTNAFANGTVVQTNICPHLQPFITGSHHRRADATSPPVVTPAFAGNANPIDLHTEASYVPLNVQGDTMIGALQCNTTLSVAGTSTLTGHVGIGASGGASTILDVNGTVNVTHILGAAELTAAGDLNVGGNANLAHDPTSALQAATKQYVDAKTAAFGFYPGNNSGQSVNVGFQPSATFIFPQGSSGPSGVNDDSYLLLGSGVSTIKSNNTFFQVFIVSSSGPAHNSTGFSVSGLNANKSGINYFYLCLR